MAAKKRTNAGSAGMKNKKNSSTPANAQSRDSPAPTEPIPAQPDPSPPIPHPESVEDLDAPARRSFPVVGIGASAGGLDAFVKFLKAMPGDSGMAFVLIPHLDPRHESLMVELLARQTPMPVREADEGQALEINHVYIIPPNKYMAIHAGRLHLTAPPEPRGHQNALDFFFRSLADQERERAIGIVLSGTGSHGTLGLKEIKLAGGIAMVRSPIRRTSTRCPRVRSPPDWSTLSFLLTRCRQR